MKAFRFPFWKKVYGRSPNTPNLNRFNCTYQAFSSASVETLWQMLVNLADVSWHPLISRADVPRGLVAKPGLIYRVMPRWLPIPMCVFVEQVSPHKLLSIRFFPVPGLEEKVTYRLESTVCGTQVSYSVLLRGWLSPVAWSVLAPCAAPIAAAIARAAERPPRCPLSAPRSPF